MLLRGLKFFSTVPWLRYDCFCPDKEKHDEEYWANNTA